MGPAALREIQSGIQSLVESSRICSDAAASVAIMNYYGPRSSGMGWHVDADTDPPHVTCEVAQNSAVVSLSIGDSCDFCYRDAGGGRGGKSEHRVKLDSGDVLVFGGPSRSVEHCVDGIYKGSRPPDLRMLPGRINVTFRHW